MHVGVRSRSGPHVTPELFTLSGGDLICLTAASTLKAKVARRDPLVAVAARTPVSSVAAVAHAQVFDPADPIAAVRAPLNALRSPIGVARFVKDNAAELTGATIDALAGRLGLPPEHRVVLALRVDRVVTTAADDPPASGPPMSLDGVPERAAALTAPSLVTVGWSGADGAPLALPGVWHGDGSASVRSELFDAFDPVTAGPVCVTFDAWSGHGPSGKHGVMLRGSGRAARDGDRVRIEVGLDRVTWWDGIETGTAPR